MLRMRIGEFELDGPTRQTPPSPLLGFSLFRLPKLTSGSTPHTRMQHLLTGGGFVFSPRTAVMRTIRQSTKHNVRLSSEGRGLGGITTGWSRSIRTTLLFTSSTRQPTNAKWNFPMALLTSYSM